MIISNDHGYVFLTKLMRKNNRVAPKKAISSASTRLFLKGKPSIPKSHSPNKAPAIPINKLTRTLKLLPSINFPAKNPAIIPGTTIDKRLVIVYEMSI